MRKKLMQVAALALATALTLAPFAAKAAIPTDNPTLRVGLFYGSTALSTANLENSTGTGYRFGYYDAHLNFNTLGATGVTKLSMGAATGYAIVLTALCTDFETAKFAADAVDGGYPAWVGGQYCVRVGGYADEAAAQAALLRLNLPGAVVATSGSAVSVMETGTGRILFQFEDGTNAFGIQPGTADGGQTVTWCKGYRYYGGFQYLRAGGNLTVINIVPLEDYLKGVVPNEMGGAWPLEALKAQAVCARNYAVIQMQAGKHRALGFDLCSTTDCQVYGGLNTASVTSDQAVDGTRGVYARYGGAPIEAYYFSSDGGATEDVGNVWRDDLNLPYLKGVADPHEAALAAYIPNYNWTVTFRQEELTALLNGKGYLNAGIVDLRVSEITPMGNVKSVVFSDAAGKQWTLSKESVRTTLGLRSMRFGITAAGSAGTVPNYSTNTGSARKEGYYVNSGNERLDTIIGAYAIGGSGKYSVISGAPYAVTGSGTVQLAPSGLQPTDPVAPPAVTGNGFTLSGTGYGHGVGMSQYGANAMAKAGYSYDEILKFYYTGIDVR